MPKKGEEMVIDGFEFKIVAADNRRIQSIQVTVPKEHQVTGKISD